MRRNLLLLSLCQAMLMTGVSLVLASSALVGEQLAPDPMLATAPLSVQYLVTMAAVWPLSHLMMRRGRRAVFLAGAGIGTAGVALAALGIRLESFALFLLAGGLIGLYNAAGQFYRFAAAEAVEPRLRSRAISLTLAGGVLAALFGPYLARLTRDALHPPFFASFLALVAVTALAAVFAAGLRLPAAPGAGAGASAAAPARPLGVIARDPIFVVAVVVGMLGYGEMNLLMTATPLAMHAHHHSFADTAAVIQWHVVAMFAPSFVSGHLIGRFGLVPVMSAGAALVLGCIAVNLAGTGLLHFELALVLLGVGWNFLYVGATTLLLESQRPAERARVQGLNDTLVFASVAATSLASGWLVAAVGWRAINLAALPALALVVVALAWLQRERQRQQRALAVAR